MTNIKDSQAEPISTVAFRDWDNWWDQANFVALNLCALAIFWISSENVYAVLMSQQLPVFIEDPFKARCISLIPAIAGFAMKAATFAMVSASVRATYRSGVIGAAIGSLVGWVYLFAEAYQSGLTNDIDLAAMLEPSSGNFAFTGVQVALEVFSGASLMLIAGTIWEKYSPDIMHTNPNRKSAEEQLENDMSKLRVTNEMLKRAVPELEKMKGAREAYIRNRVTEARGHAKRIGLICLLVCAGAGLPATDALATDYVVAVSPASSPEEKTAVMAKAIDWMTKLDAGDRALLHDGVTGEYLGEFKVPTDSRYQNPKARVMANRQVVAQVMQFAKQPAPIGWTDYGLHVPTLFQSIGQYHRDAEALDVVIVGSPVFHDPAMEAFSMRGNRFPGEGHLTVTRRLSPFGARGSEALLKDVRVHWATMKPPEDSRLRFELQRFYSLYTQALGGELASYDRSLERVFQNAKGGRSSQANAFERNGSTKVEMVQLAPIRLSKKTIYEREITSAPMPDSVVQKAERVEIGARWQCECDVDVYAQPVPGADVLYFGNTRTAQGLFFKDYQGPNAKEGYETIEFTVPLDLRAVRVAVNLYSGSAPNGVSGEFRMSVNGKTYAIPFSIPATEGNQGADAPKNGFKGRSTKHTVVLDLSKMLGV